MKLYEIPKGSRIKAETFNGAGEKTGDWITFHHLDGMYSYCTDEKGNPLHLGGAIELKSSDDLSYYLISE